MRFHFSTVATALLLLGIICAPLSAAQTAAESSTQLSSAYPDSWAGLEAQFSDALRLSRSGDQAGFQEALNSLAIPDSDAWIAANFAPKDVATVQNEYRDSLKSSKSHVSWVLGTFAKYPDFALRVETSLTPKPHSDVGFQGLLPSPISPVKIENFRFTSSSSNPEHGPPSWVSSFIYIDGRFRMIGGTFPFWAEASTALTGPMSIPAAEIHGRTVQGAAFRNDKIGPGIDAIVHLKIEVGHDGKVKHIKVLSGDAAFVADAKTYVQNAQFPELPDDPLLANMKAEWDMEVVFFPPKLMRLLPKN